MKSVYQGQTDKSSISESGIWVIAVNLGPAGHLFVGGRVVGFFQADDFSAVSDPHAYISKSASLSCVFQKPIMESASTAPAGAATSIIKNSTKMAILPNILNSPIVPRQAAATGIIHCRC